MVIRMEGVMGWGMNSRCRSLQDSGEDMEERNLMNKSDGG
jgi:hypothetical protein